MKRINTVADWGNDGWDNFFIEKGKQWRNKDYRHLNELFDLSVMTGSLLDAGCALGDGLIYLRNKCPGIDKFEGTDFSSEAVQICKENPQQAGIRFFQHDILAPLPRQYDNVICLQTLEHVKDPSLAISNLSDAAKDMLIVAVPYRNRRPDKDHHWYFDENDFSEIADAHCLDRKKKNIYWLFDKQKKGLKFSIKRFSALRKFSPKLFKPFV